MSTIRDGLLALLTQGEAYGLQLRNELDSRLKRAHHTNVGQIYSTLDRLVQAGLVTQTSHTGDGLPLYSLTHDGKRVTEEWLRHPHVEPSNRWDSMVAQVLIARSLTNVNSSPLIHALREYWQEQLASALSSYAHDTSSDLRSGSDEQLCLAALAWLDRVDETDDHGWPLSPVRPARGRPATQR